MLHHISPRREGSPVCVLPTPGCYNSAYFEHCNHAPIMGSYRGSAHCRLEVSVTVERLVG
jgi:hypothetical protein